MITADELRAFTELLRNTFSSTALPAERQQELLLIGILAELEHEALSSTGGAAQAPAQNAPKNGTSAPELPEPAQLLYEATAAHPSSAVRRQGFNGLLRLAVENHPAAVDALFRLAVEEDLLGARQAIITYNWQPRSAGLRALFDWFTTLDTPRPYPEENLPALSDAYFNEASPALQRRLLLTAGQNRAGSWARIITAIQQGTLEALSGLVESYPTFSQAERQLALDHLTRLAKLGSRPAQETISLLFIRHEDPRARQIALEYAYLPEDPEARALFLFLAEAWDQYETLDFNHNLLVNAYESAGRSLRRRLMEHSRHTGQMDWLRTSGAASEVRWLNDLSDADWDLVIRRLDEGQKTAELWRLAQVSPPLWSAAILDRLEKNGWSPEDADERAGFSNLSGLAQACLAAPLTARPRKALHAPANEITCLALQPDGRELAAGSTGPQIYRWALPEGTPRTTLTGPTPVTRALAYSPDGEYLASASGDNRIRVFRLESGQILKNLEGHRAMIRGLAIQPDGRTLYSAGFDGSLRTWRFPAGPELTSQRPGPEEIFSLVISGGGRYLLTAGADGLIRVWTLPEVTPAREIGGHMGTITHLAANPTGDLVASAGREGVVHLWNYTTGGLVRSIQNPGSPLTALCLHPNEQVLFGGHASGDISLWSISTGRLIDTLSAHRQPISGLVLALAGDLLYSADSAAHVQVWDLRTFLAIRLPGETIRPGAIDALQERSTNPNLSAAEKKWLAFSTELARWRQRFDIELADFDTIQVGEFDIELS